MIVFVRYNLGPGVAVELQEETSVAQLKEIVGSQQGVQPEHLRVLFAGRFLKSSAKLQDCDLPEQSTIHVVLPPSGSSTSQLGLLQERLARGGDAEQDSLTRLDLSSSRLSSTSSGLAVILEGDDGGEGVRGAEGQAACLRGSHVYSTFFVYCKSCRSIQPGKLRVRCCSCKQTTLTLSRGPSCWDDVLLRDRIHGVCQTADCQGNIAEFYMKCASHPTSDDDVSAALDLILSNSRDVPCIACTDVMDVVLVFQCLERHVICLDCFHRYCQTRLNERHFVHHPVIGYSLPCAAGCPDSLIKELHHFRILGDEQYGRYLQYGAEECLQEIGGLMCPSPGCGAGLVPIEGSRRVECDRQLGCGFVFCKDCREEYHEGACHTELVPPPDEASQGFVVDEEASLRGRWDRASLLLVQETTKRCPQCSVPVERNGGCMHMQCPLCKAEWCWICRVPDSPLVPLSPQGSASKSIQAAAWWASYSCSRWKHRRKKLKGIHLETRYRGLAEGDESDEEQKDETDTSKNHQLNKQLLDHFRQLAANNQDTDQVDLQFLDEVISNGADPNSCDRYGQTIQHEISRAWSVDVMRFFLDRGSDLLRPDHFGVTALHVASALDYQEMVQFLLDHKANPEARTVLDQQTPLHYAAKNDAAGSIRLLLQAGASISCTDYKHRTPLQLAANMERSEAAQVLMDFGAEAGLIDADGQLCITALIGRMSPVALLALSQFHVTDRLTRQQFYYLNLLEPVPHLRNTPVQEATMSEPTSPLEVAVHQGKLDLIMHPVFLKLIEIKWRLYGRLGAWLLLILNILFNISWTTVAISVSIHKGSSDRYTLPEDWWRVFAVVLALLLTLEEVLREVQDILRSRKKMRLWQQWAERRLSDDLQCSHPMWPQVGSSRLNIR
ncbi:hypothetical protein NQZ68_029674 [Xyrichtys novacula]|uniref:E3 ubiquitin-protein ligase parkin n=1 Tax=Xyrichtys novacula TaxID=13765 RepID=A0AAV1FYF9_XYRNO|nr:hypothetical protein NQZ68_029674 [Xyrichtys novacula]